MAEPRKRKAPRARSPASAAPTLAELQDAFQRAIMSGDDAVLALIPNSSREKRDVLLGVYRHAYVARLIEFLQNDYPKLHEYLGDEAFDDMGRAYAATHPSDQPNARWFGRHVPDFLRRAGPYASFAILGDLAEIEKALSDVFDAPDRITITMSDLQNIPPERWDRLSFSAQPSTIKLELQSNAVDIWLALNDGADPPEAVSGGETYRVLVWRQDGTPKLRAIGAEEAMLWEEAMKGVRFGVLCEMAALYDEPDNAPVRAATYLNGWIVSEMLAGWSLNERRSTPSRKSRSKRKA
jgi:hypothetical protein